MIFFQLLSRNPIPSPSHHLQLQYVQSAQHFQTYAAASGQTPVSNCSFLDIPPHLHNFHPPNHFCASCHCLASSLCIVVWSCLLTKVLYCHILLACCILCCRLKYTSLLFYCLGFLLYKLGEILETKLLCQLNAC